MIQSVLLRGRGETVYPFLIAYLLQKSNNELVSITAIMRQVRMELSWTKG